MNVRIKRLVGLTLDLWGLTEERGLGSGDHRWSHLEFNSLLSPNLPLGPELHGGSEGGKTHFLQVWDCAFPRPLDGVLGGHPWPAPDGRGWADVSRTSPLPPSPAVLSCTWREEAGPEAGVHLNWGPAILWGWEQVCVSASRAIRASGCGQDVSVHRQDRQT